MQTCMRGNWISRKVWKFALNAFWELLDDCLARSHCHRSSSSIWEIGQPVISNSAAATVKLTWHFYKRGLHTNNATESAMDFYD